MNILLWQVPIVCFLASSDSALAQLKPNPITDSKVVFRKTLPQKQTLQVLQQEIPYIPPPEAKALGPNVHLGIPDHVYLYTFQLHSGHNVVVLWTPTRNHFSENGFSAEPTLRVLDANVSKGKLCVVYKQGGVAYANIITSGAPLDKPGINWRDSLLTIDSDPKQIFVKSGTLSGSLESGSLSADLINSDGRHFRYRLTGDKWVKVGPLPEAASGAEPKPAAK